MSKVTSKSQYINKSRFKNLWNSSVLRWMRKVFGDGAERDTTTDQIVAIFWPWPLTLIPLCHRYQLAVIKHWWQSAGFDSIRTPLCLLFCSKDDLSIHTKLSPIYSMCTRIWYTEICCSRKADTLIFSFLAISGYDNRGLPTVLG